MDCFDVSRGGNCSYGMELIEAGCNDCKEGCELCCGVSHQGGADEVKISADPAPPVQQEMEEIKQPQPQLQPQQQEQQQPPSSPPHSPPSQSPKASSTPVEKKREFDSDRDSHLACSSEDSPILPSTFETPLAFWKAVQGQGKKEVNLTGTSLEETMTQRKMAQKSHT